MTHIVYFDGRAANCDSQRKLTHVLIGRKNEEKFRPEERLFTTPSHLLTPEENKTMLQFSHDKIRFGEYELHVLDWFENESDASESIAKWSEDYIEVRVQKINTVSR